MHLRIASLLVVAGISLGVVSMARAAEVRLTAASFQPQNVVFARHFYQWVRETNARCADEVAIKVVGPDEIASHEQWYALQTGQIDMYFGPANYYRGVLPHGDVFNLAHNDPSDQRTNGAWALLNAIHNERLNAWHLTTLIAGVEFFVYTTKPAADGRFDGLRLRSVPLFENFLRSLGAQTEIMLAPALREALEGGVIDGYVWPLWGLDVFGWQEFTKYRYGPGFMNTASPVLVNLDRFRSLTDDQRSCLSDMAIWLETKWAEWRSVEDTIQLAVLEEAGIEYLDLGASFARRAEDLHWAQLELAEPQFVERIRPLLTSAD